MKYSLVNGIKQNPTPKTKGVCICCGSPTHSKCGNRNVWHWAHDSKQMCDPWWENETPWHRLWKSYFPDKNQEVVQFDNLTGEKHIADVKTDNGMIIEFQNSPINEKELNSREIFYDKMIWIVNGEKFKKNFQITSKLPSPSSKIAKEIFIFYPPVNTAYHPYSMRSGYHGMNGFFFFKRSQAPNYIENLTKGYVFGGEIYESIDIQQEINESYDGHHLFYWKNKRSIWYQSNKPVFIDFGDNLLWCLQVYDEQGLRCVEKINKEDFIKNNGGEYKREIIE